MDYEGKVATGVLPVFYTGGFYEAIPILFQYQVLLPFLINPVITIISVPALFYFLFFFFKTQNKYIAVIILLHFSLFIVQSILFVKWVRYVIPSLAFIYIMVAVYLFDLKKIISRRLYLTAVTLIILLSFSQALSFVKTVRVAPDTRVEASNFASKIIPEGSAILSEVYDMGIVPFNDHNKNIKLFNFYDLDTNPAVQNNLEQDLAWAEYIILPSQRVYKTRLGSNRFPQGRKFYSSLLGENLDFYKIYETPCDIFCKVTYLGDPVFNVEETANVFDRPSVVIFKKR
jgi:hypothetical protein